MAFETAIGADWNVFLVESVVGWGLLQAVFSRITGLIVDTRCGAIAVVIIVVY